MKQSSLRVVQITDLHVTETEGECLYGVESGQSLRKVLASISALHPPAAMIIATGDLIDRKTVQSYRRLRQIFSQIDLPIYVLCGNHDSRYLLEQALVGGRIFYQECVETDHWTLIFTDTTVEAENYGRISAHELSMLKQNLDRTNNKHALVALHHPTIKSCPSAGCQLQASDEFVEFLKGQAMVKAVVAGHTHLAAEIRGPDLIQFTTPSTFAQVTHAPGADPAGLEDFLKSHELDSSRHGYRILDLFANGEINSSVAWVAADISN